MKNFYVLLIFCCILTSCSDDNNQATSITPSPSNLASKPEANPMFDYSYKGIYKGIVIGNISGSLYIDLLNDNQIWARLQTSNQETHILENVPLSEDDGRSISPVLQKYRFANEHVSFEIKLDETGNNISVTNFKYFSDNTAKVCLLKEQSTSLIKCYTGIFIGQNESGDINFTSDGHLKIKGLSKELNSSNVTAVNGEVKIISPVDVLTKIDESNNLLSKVEIKANLHFGEVSGFLNGYEVDGNWMFDNDKLGIWNAKRIL